MLQLMGYGRCNTILSVIFMIWKTHPNKEHQGSTQKQQPFINNYIIYIYK